MTKERKSRARCRYDSKHRRLHTGEYVRGKRYEYKYYDIFGVRKSEYADTLAELREIEANIDQYRIKGKHTLDQVMQECFKLAGKEVSANTLIGYVKTYKRYIRPVFGKKNINSIKPIDIKRFYLALHNDKKLSVSTIEGIHAVLHRILDFAKDAELIMSNPSDDKMSCLAMAKRSERQEKPKALEREVRDKYLRFLLEKYSFAPLVLIIYLMAKFGFRCGEVTGLTANDVDYDERLIHITHTLSYGYIDSDLDESLDHRECDFRASNPKTFASRRSVPCDDDRLLAQLKKREGRNRRIKRVRVGDYKGFLFVKEDGTPFTNRNVNDFLKRTAREYNAEETMAAARENREPLLLPDNLSSHIFRRTAATLLNNGGYSLADIQSLLGHVDIDTTTSRYCCPSLKRAREVAKSLI